MHYFQQEEIYKSGKVTGVVRMFRGKYTIPDDSTLDELNIMDGNTVNFLIEPDQCVNIYVECGPKTYQLETSLSIQVKELKQLLIKNNQVALLYEYFHLAMISSDDDVYQETKLTDESLPLHFYSVQNGSTLKVIRTFIQLNIIDTRNEMHYKSIPSDITIQELKKTIMYSKQYSEVHYGSFDNIIMFTKTDDNVYKRLCENCKITVGDLLSDNDTIYLSSDNFFKNFYPLYYNGNEIGKVGVGFEESVLSIKLRTQEQMGIPVSNIRILDRIPHKVKVRAGNPNPGNPAVNPQQNPAGYPNPANPAGNPNPGNPAVNLQQNPAGYPNPANPAGHPNPGYSNPANPTGHPNVGYPAGFLQEQHYPGLSDRTKLNGMYKHYIEII